MPNPRARQARDEPDGLVIFDCDGVLIDSEVISAAVLIELAAEAGVRLDAGYVRAHFLGRSFPTVAQAIRAGAPGGLPPDFEALYRARLLDRFEGELTMTPGVEGAIARLRVAACVATSSSPPRAARSLAIVGLDRRFQRVFTASEVARGKPAPDLFLHAAAAMGVAPARCLVIEDSRPGLLAAAAAGMTAAFFTGGSHMGGDAAAFDMGPPHRAFGDWTTLADAFPRLFGPPPLAPGPQA